MKTEITLENKAKFFAQYWSQEVLSDNIVFNSLTVDVYKFGDSRISPSSLCLKSITEISEGDIKSIIEKLGYKADNWDEVSSWKKYIISMGVDMRLNVSDYLRYKGYALPWMGLSVEEMIEAGWIKLHNKSSEGSKNKEI